jgi:hypothetical protein
VGWVGCVIIWQIYGIFLNKKAGVVINFFGVLSA